LSKVNEKDNSILTVAYNSSGSQFATAGRDRFVRVYDENTKQLQQTMGSSILDAAAGHANRVFSSCYDPEDPNTLLTGGWDNTVHIWDLRTGRSQRKLFGPHIAGDALHVHNGRVLTGSWRPEDPLQTWDLASGKLLCSAQYNPGAGKAGLPSLDTYTSHNAPGLIYGATFNTDGTFAVAGGSGNNSVKVFDTTADDRMPLIGAILGLPGAVFAVAAHDSMVAVAGAFDQVYVYEVVASASSVASVVHEGFQPGDSPTARTPYHSGAAGFSDSKEPYDGAAAAAAAASSNVADRVMASLHTVTLHEDDAAGEDSADSMGGETPVATPTEGKAEEDFGTRSGIVGGSALAAVRARRSSAPGAEEGKE